MLMQDIPIGHIAFNKLTGSTYIKTSLGAVVIDSFAYFDNSNFGSSSYVDMGKLNINIKEEVVTTTKIVAKVSVQ